MTVRTTKAVAVEHPVKVRSTNFVFLLSLAAGCVFGQGKASVTIDKQEYRIGESVRVSARYLGDPAQVQEADASFWTKTFGLRKYPLVLNKTSGLWEGSIPVPEISNTASPSLHVDFTTAHAADWVLLQGGRDFPNPRIIGLQVFERGPKASRLVAFPTKATLMRVELDADVEAGLDEGYAVPQMQRRALDQVPFRCEGGTSIRCSAEINWGQQEVNQPGLHVRLRDRATSYVDLESGRDFQVIYPGEVKDSSWPGFDVRSVTFRTCEGGLASLAFTAPFLIVRYGWAAVMSARVPLSSAPLTCIAEQGCQLDFPRSDLLRSARAPDGIMVSLQMSSGAVYQKEFPIDSSVLHQLPPDSGPCREGTFNAVEPRKSEPQPVPKKLPVAPKKGPAAAKKGPSALPR